MVHRHTLGYSILLLVAWSATYLNRFGSHLAFITKELINPKEQATESSNRNTLHVPRLNESSASLVADQLVHAQQLLNETLTDRSNSVDDATVPLSLEQNITWPFTNNSNDVRAYFIHVGKTGGMGFSLRLGLQTVAKRLPCRINSMNANRSDAGCFRYHRQPSIALTRHIFGTLHLYQYYYSSAMRQWLQNNTNLLIFLCRDPIDRIVSAFNYHRHNWLKASKNGTIQSNRIFRMGKFIFQDCFPTVHALVQALDPHPTTNVTQECRTQAFHILQGKGPGKLVPHFNYNYNYYKTKAWHNQTKAVAVVRTNSLWPDTARLEGLLGGNPGPFLKERSKYTHGSESYSNNTKSTGISNDSARNLCCILRSELQVYQELIVAAVNLEAAEKAQTLRELLQHCGVQRDFTRSEILNWQWSKWECKEESNLVETE